MLSGFVDIDIRSHIYETTGEVINDEKKLFEEIDRNYINSYWKMILRFRLYTIHSGNWLHLYYIGDEIAINKSDYLPLSTILYFYKIQHYQNYDMFQDPVWS